MRIPIAVRSRLRPGLFVEIDDEDHQLISGYFWKIKIKGPRIYAVSTTKPRIQMHRLITGAPAGFDVDHADHNCLNNKKSNLRVCTRSQNSANRQLSPKNKAGFKGVHKHKTLKNGTVVWAAMITKNYKQRRLGLFKDLLAAARAYDRAAVDLFGEFALLNFPEKSDCFRLDAGLVASAEQPPPPPLTAEINLGETFQKNPK